MSQPYVYKILRASEWREFESSGVFAGSSDDRRDGFIHLSAAEQVKGTLDKHFESERDLHVVQITSAALADDLRFEISRGGTPFPHLYRELLISDVAQVMSVREFFSFSDQVQR